MAQRSVARARLAFTLICLSGISLAGPATADAPAHPDPGHPDSASSTPTKDLIKDLMGPPPPVPVEARVPQSLLDNAVHTANQGDFGPAEGRAPAVGAGYVFLSVLIIGIFVISRLVG